MDLALLGLLVAWIRRKGGSEGRTGAGLVAAISSPPYTEIGTPGHLAITSSMGIIEGWSVEESL